MITIAYILGSTRSGTSALRNALVETRYFGYGEGHLVPVLSDIIQSVLHHKTEGLGATVSGNGLHNMNPHEILRHLFRGYELYFSGQIGSEFLVDKTPTITPIRMAPDLNAFHQNPRFIHCTRRHLDNVQSKRKKFPDQPFRQQCREWSDCNLAWLDVKERLDGNFLAFDFHDLVSDPAQIAVQVGEYLDLNADEIAAFSAYLIAKRPQANPDRDLMQFLKLSEMDWTDEEKQIFTNICSPVGEKLGYSMESYYA